MLKNIQEVKDVRRDLRFSYPMGHDNSNTCKTLKSTEVIRGILQCAIYVQISSGYQ